MKRVLLTILLILAFVLMQVPYETVHAPEWQIKVVDQYGNPVVGRNVGQFCRDYTLDLAPCMDAHDGGAVTDESGMVSFPERRVRMNALSRIARSAKSYVLWISHGSVGSDIYVQATSSEGVKRLSLESGKALPTKFVLPIKDPDIDEKVKEVDSDSAK